MNYSEVARIGVRINQNREKYAIKMNTSANAASRRRRRKMPTNPNKELEPKTRKRIRCKMEYDPYQNTVKVIGETNVFQRAMISEIFK